MYANCFIGFRSRNSHHHQMFRCLPSSSNNRINDIPSFTDLAMEQRFDEIIDLIQSGSVSEDWLQGGTNNNNAVTKYKHTTGPKGATTRDAPYKPMDALHTLCSYRPTVQVVQTVINFIKQIRSSQNGKCSSSAIQQHILKTNHSEVDTELNSFDCSISNNDQQYNGNSNGSCNYDPADDRDIHGRTALHIAVASGCSYQIIQLLCKGSTATLTVDNGGRFPLHWACDLGIRLLGNNSNKQKHVEFKHIIQLLMDSYPIAVTMKDKNGMTPLDLALRNNNAPQLIIREIKYVVQLLPNDGCTTDTTSDVEDIDTNTFDSEVLIDISSVSFPIRSPDEDIFDDMSSIGSKGVSEHRRRFPGAQAQADNLVDL